MKKGQGISLTTIVVAAIALVVLVVLIILFSNRIGFFNRGIEQCPAGTEPVEPAKCDDLIPKKVIKKGDELVYCCKPKTLAAAARALTSAEIENQRIEKRIQAIDAQLAKTDLDASTRKRLEEERIRLNGQIIVG